MIIFTLITSIIQIICAFLLSKIADNAIRKNKELKERNYKLFNEKQELINEIWSLQNKVDRYEKVLKLRDSKN